MQPNTHEVFFFLEDDENEAFIKYCKSSGVMPYIVGQQLVKDFLMDNTKESIKMMSKSEYEERLSTLEGRFEALAKAWMKQDVKCQELEEAIADIEQEIEGMDVRGAVDDLEYSLETLQDNVNDLLHQAVLPD